MQLIWQSHRLLFVAIFGINDICSVDTAADGFHGKTRKPMKGIRSQIDSDEWPSHELGCLTFFRSISNCTESNAWATKALLDQ